MVGVSHSPKCFKRFQSCVYLEEEHLPSCYDSCVLMAQCFCNRLGLLTKSTKYFKSVLLRTQQQPS